MGTVAMNFNDANAAQANVPGGRERLYELNATDDERLWATFIHLAGLGGFILPTASIFAPLILWLMKRKTSPFIDDHGREAVNFQISVFLYAIVSAVLMTVCVGFVLVPLVLLLQIIASIVMAIRANGGEYVRYPVTIRFLS